MGTQYGDSDSHRAENGRDAEKDGKPHQSRQRQPRWRVGSQNNGGQRCEKKDPERTAPLLFLPICFHARSLVEAAPGVHPAMARRIAVNIAKLPELARFCLTLLVAATGLPAASGVARG